MNREHVIANELFDYAVAELAKGNNWIAYNTIPYFLDKEEMQFFKTSDEAHEYSDSNISEYDNYRCFILTRWLTCYDKFHTVKIFYQLILKS